MKLPLIEQPYDTNLLSWMFIIARNDYLFHNVLLILNFIRDHPHMSEGQVRRELEHARKGTSETS